MYYGDLYDLSRDYHNERLREAQRERQWRSISTERTALHYSLMAWAGRRLVASGRYLLNTVENERDALRKANEHAVQHL